MTASPTFTGSKVGRAGPVRRAGGPVAVVGGAEQHRLLSQRDAALALLEHAVAHEGGLGQLVDAGDQDGPAPFGPGGAELLG